MMKTLLLICGTAFLFSCSSKAPEPEPELEDEGGITGLWKSRDQDSEKPRCLVVIYKYGDLYFGRMLATYDDDGNIKDTILEQKSKAKGVVGNPPYCGMDFVFNVRKLEDHGVTIGEYKGKIIDPEKGEVYKARLWRDSDDVLILRGELWVFGKNIPWYKASVKDLPEGFSMKEVKNFLPAVPVPI